MASLHPPLQRKLIEALQDIFDQGYFSDQVLDRYFKANRKWGSRDRKSFAHSLYGIVRWVRPLMSEAGVEWNEGWEPKKELMSQFTGLKGLSDDAWAEVCKVWVQRSDEIEEEGFYPEEEAWELRYSLSDYSLKLFREQMDGDFEAELFALNQTAPVYIRANGLKTNKKELFSKLQEEGYELQIVNDLDSGLKLLERKSIFQSKAFQAGLFEMQDGGSQKIAEFMQVKPGLKVVDACAGAGGKSLHLAALMENKGRIVAMDIFPKKLEELERRARRAGAFNIETRLIDSTKVVKRLEGYADRVLLDVPCTGSGVYRRNPDAKWRLSPYELEALVAEQKRILGLYCKMLKSGGKLIYSTCSLLKAENSGQVQEFLKSEIGQNFELEEEKSILPSETDYDGFYMARLIRK